MELICTSPDLLHWLGAVIPETREQHKQMRDRGDIVVRSFLSVSVTPTMFWELVPEKIAAKK